MRRRRAWGDGQRTSHTGYAGEVLALRVEQDRQIVVGLAMARVQLDRAAVERESAFDVAGVMALERRAEGPLSTLAVLTPTSTRFRFAREGACLPPACETRDGGARRRAPGG